MRLLFWLALVLAPCAAWDTAPHRSITRAARQSLPTGITGDRQSDRASLVFLFEQIVSALSSNRRDDAANFAGVLSHFIADSLSPPHAVSAERLQEMAEDYPGNIHSALERSLPEFRL